MKRFKTENAKKIVDFLHRSGLDESAEVISASRSYNGGCSDPLCCYTHPDPENYRNIRTHVESKTLTRIKKIICK